MILKSFLWLLSLLVVNGVFGKLHDWSKGQALEPLMLGFTFFSAIGIWGSLIWFLWEIVNWAWVVMT